MSVFRALVGGTAIVIVTLSIGIEQTHAQLCDFDGDGFCNTGDIDALSEQVILGDPNFDPKFDLTVDGQLNLADRDEWLSLAAIENGFGSPYFLGDANLDGWVNAADLMTLGLYWQSDADRWSEADFNMDATVNSADLNALAINWQKKNPPAAAVPEPLGCLLVLFGAASVHRLARTHRRGLVLVVIVWSLVFGSFTGITLAQLECDLNSDGICDVVDIDNLTRAIATNSDDPLYDLNADGVVNADDLYPWLESGAAENGFAEPYVTGDAELDGDVDAADLNALALSWQQSGKVWSQGDFVPDGTVNASDLMSLAINWRIEIARAAAAVPEPMSCVPLILGGWLLFHTARRVSLRLIVIPLILCGLAEVAFAQPLCDLDGDGICDILDIDDLSREIASGVLTDPKYDLNNDGVLDQQDLEEWLALGGDENGFAAPYLRGDANLDGTVNATDLNALGLHWQQSDRVWSQGDFSADGSVDAQDLMLVGLNWQQRIPLAAAAVPEPMSCVPLILGGWLLFHTARRVSLRLIVIPLLLCGLAEVAFAQPLCDLDGDGICDTLDIDDLSREIASGVLTDPKYDLNEDGILDEWDLHEWLSLGGTENGFAAPYLRGDANLDGTVNATDLNALALNWLQAGKVWSQGDFFADGVVNASDLMHLGQNWQQVIPRAAATVPEPVSFLLLLVGALGVHQFVRRYRREAMAPMCADSLISSPSATDIWSQFL